MCYDNVMCPFYCTGICAYGTVLFRVFTILMQEMKQLYGKTGAWEGSHLSVEFKQNKIELDIPRDGMSLTAGKCNPCGLVE